MTVIEFQLRHKDITVTSINIDLSRGTLVVGTTVLFELLMASVEVLQYQWIKQFLYKQ